MKKKKSKSRPPKNQGKEYQQAKKQFKKNSYADLLGLGIILLLGIIIYSNSFSCSFHFDDTQKIVENSKIRNLFDIKALWDFSQTRFIPFYTFAINYHFGELNVWGYHLFNLVIHLINACLVYWLTLLIFSCPVLKDKPILKNKKILALLTALLFVSHPLATQSVTYIVQRMASMVALFYLLSLALYLKARLTDKNNLSKNLLFAGSSIVAVLAMLTKQNAFTLPFAIVLFEIFFFQTKKLSMNIKDYRVTVLITGLLGFILIVLFKFSFSIFQPLPPDIFNDFQTVTSSNYLFTQFSVIVKYIQLLFLPINQNLDHDFALSNNFFEIKTIICFLFLLSLIIIATFLFKKNRIISFGIFWFFLTLSVESSIIPISDLIVEHRTYLPSFGFFLILSSGIYALLWNKYKNIAFGILVVIIGANSYLTYERNKVWLNDFTLWNDAVTKSPNKARPYYNRGIALADEKKSDLAYKDYSKAIELSPHFFKAYNNRGNIFKVENKFDKALEDYTKAIELNPSYLQAYNNRGSVYISVKKYVEGIKDLNKAIELKPDFAEAYANRGVAELNLGDKENSCRDFKKAIELGFKPVEEVYNKNCH